MDIQPRTKTQNFCWTAMRQNPDKQTEFFIRLCKNLWNYFWVINVAIYASVWNQKSMELREELIESLIK